MATKLVSIITPTYRRAEFLPHLCASVTSQTWPTLEWLVEDDSPEPSQFMQSLSDPRFHYTHSPIRRSIGEKRNALIARAKGEYIVHCDDDDYYSPHYIAHMIAAMEESEADFCKLSGFFLFYKESRDLAYWNLLVKTGVHFRWDSGSLLPILVTEQNNAQLLQMHMGFGFSYVYRRSLWESIKFPDVDISEDGQFILAASQTRRIVLLPDTKGLCLHIVHGANVSQCFPQFVLPPFMVDSIFPGASPYTTK